MYLFENYASVLVLKGIPSINCFRVTYKACKCDAICKLVFASFTRF